MEYTIECFKNTGFTPSNVPYSAAVVRNNNTATTFPAVWLLQNRDRSSVKIATTYSNVKDVDYCFIGDMYYWVTGVVMHNENMAELSLLPDYLTTIGIANLNITSGWCTRRHTNDDTLFSNTIDENFTPLEPLKIDVDPANMLMPSDDRESTEIITATVNLSADLQAIAQTFTDDTTALTVTVPVVPNAPYSTRYALSSKQRMGTKVPGVMAFDSSNATVKASVQAVRSLGIDQAITGSYVIPNCYIYEKLESNGVYTGLVANVVDVTTGLNPVYMTGIKNNKAFTGQFQRVCLAATASPDKAEFEAHDIWESGNFKFTLFADLMPDGRPFCRPATYYGNTDNLFLGTVAGGVWQNQPVAYSSPSGAALDTANTRREIQTGLATTATGAVTNTIGAVGSGMAGNAVGAVGGAVGAVTGVANGLFQAGNNAYQHNVRNVVVAPEVVFSKAAGLQNYLGNLFFVYRYRLSPSDTIKFDNYLTQFGYATNETLTQNCFTGRKHFNYVQAEGVNINASYPMSMRLGAIAQLTAGVRVWHKMPTIGAMYDNPIA